MERDVTTLPKAHLHLHFTGSMRPSTLKELADKHRIRLPESLREHHLLRIFAKLGVDDRTRAVTVAMERGILPAPR